MIDEFDKKFELETLESFDPKAFEGNADIPQDICNFILTLALVFNDLKDFLYANYYIQKLKPECELKINRMSGHYTGIDGHLKRNIIGYIHELMNLINDNEKVIEHPFFKSIISKLAIGEQEAWASLVDSSFKKQNSTDIGKYLLHIRNQVVFHYEPKAIYKGYKQFFTTGNTSNKGTERAFMSRGTNMAATRYYFADAAINGCFSAYNKENSDTDIFSDSVMLIDKLNFTIMDILDKYLARRCCAIRGEHEEN